MSLVWRSGMGNSEPLCAFQENLSDHKGHILHTCSDCLLWTDTFRNGDVTGRYILQFSKFGPPSGSIQLLEIFTCSNTFF